MVSTQQFHQQFLVDAYINRRLTLIKGEGVFLFDEKGEKYLDLMSNYGVSIFGHNHPVINQAIANQLKQLSTLHGSFINDVREEASAQLIDRCGNQYSQMYWSNSGAEAVEAAIKFAVLTTKKQKFISCEHAYHGKTLGALSATAGEKYKKPFEPLLWDFVKVPFNNLKALEAAIDNKTAGFIIEPIQGEGGIHASDSEYLRQVRKICTEKNIMLIIDEVQTGMGRTGSFLNSQKAGIAGDILCLAKGLSGGISAGATIVSKKVGQSTSKNMHSSTLGGNPLACAGTLAVLDLLDKKMLNHVVEIGQYFKEQLFSLQSEYIQDIRGEGLMLGLTVKPEKRTAVLKQLQDHRILAIPSGNDVVRFLPPFLIKKEHVDTTIAVLQTIFKGL